MSVFSITDSQGLATHWHKLHVLLRHTPASAVAELRRPCPQVLPPSIDFLDELKPLARDAGLADLFARHLLSGLLTACSVLDKSWMECTERLIRHHLPGVDPALALHSTWTPVPVPVCRGRNGSVIWFMLGRTDRPMAPACVADPEPDPRTLTALTAALERVPGSVNHACLFWSIQDTHERPVSGDSLQLPMAMAARMLDDETRWPGGLFATGALDALGRLRPVDHIMEKYHAVAWENRLFLFPQPSVITTVPPQNSLACVTLDDALFAATWFSSGMAPEKIALYRACQQRTELILDHFPELPIELINLPQFRHHLEKVKKTPETFLPQLCTALQRCSFDPVRSRQLADLCPVSSLTRLFTESSGPYHIFLEWCLAQVNYLNHRGKVTETREWKTVAERIRQQIKSCDEGSGELLNHLMVTLRFNRYDFRPEPPAALTSFLREEEEIHCRRPRDNRLLGAMYGTLAQNYGFCGPEFFTGLLKMCRRAETAFGSRYRHETIRLQNYRIYGLLDSGYFRAAEILTARYLGLDSAAAPTAWLQTIADMIDQSEQNTASHFPFLTATVIRVLADLFPETGQPVTPGTAPLQTTALRTLQEKAHPWQLTALNLGRLFLATGARQQAEKLLRHSLHLCLAGGETMRAMALLPLAELEQSQLARQDDYRMAEETVRWLHSTDTINSDHFRALQPQREGKSLLMTVFRNRAHLFPFTYR